jgi:hypothetical protein
VKRKVSWMPHAPVEAKKGIKKIKSAFAWSNRFNLNPGIQISCEMCL